jgi:hypothetical protein
MTADGCSPEDDLQGFLNPLTLQTLMGGILDPIDLEAYLGSFAVLSCRVLKREERPRLFERSAMNAVVEIGRRGVGVGS